MEDNFYSPEMDKQILDYYSQKNKTSNNINTSSFSSKYVTNEEVSSSNISDAHHTCYGDICEKPLLNAIDNITFDFNHGLRICFSDKEKEYHLIVKDEDTEMIFVNDIVKNITVYSIKKYYIRFGFYIYDSNEKLIYKHVLNLNNRKVLVVFPVNTLGDSIAWFSYLERFQQKNNCQLSVIVNQNITNIFKNQYPQFNFINNQEDINETFNKYKFYATYYLGLFFNGELNYQPIDFRNVGLHKTAGMILGLRTEEELKDIPPRIDLTAKRKIKGKYVVIATQASMQSKYWNNPEGWRLVIDFLKENGYKVICIDKQKVNGQHYTYNYIPWGVEDYTGDLPLQERIDIIKDADFFIGLPSGLSWLAWCCKVPVVLISGFSLPKTEFYTPYRIINYNTCCGCWDDIKEKFDHNDFFWCPRQEENKNKFECTKNINAKMVINTIQTIPTFKPKKS